MILIEITNPSEHQGAELHMLGEFLISLGKARIDGRIEDAKGLNWSLTGSNATLRAASDSPAVKGDKPAFAVNPTTGEVLVDAATVSSVAVSPSPVSLQPAPLPDAPDAAAVFGGAVAPAPLAPVAGAAAPAPAVAPAPVVTPAPVAAATSTPATPQPAASPSSSVELDSAGLPWDARIHSKNKTKTQDGKWKKSRGVDPAYVTECETQNRAILAGSGAAPAPAAAAQPAPVAVAPAPVAVAPAPAPAAVAPAPAAVQPAAPSVTVGDVFKRISALQAEKDANGMPIHLTSAALAEALTEVGFSSITDLQRAPHLAESLLIAIEARAV